MVVIHISQYVGPIEFDLSNDIYSILNVKYMIRNRLGVEVERQRLFLLDNTEISNTDYVSTNDLRLLVRNEAYHQTDLQAMTAMNSWKRIPNVIIRTRPNMSRAFLIDSHFSVRSLKHLIQQWSGIPVDDQRLWHSASAYDIDDHILISSIGLEPDDREWYLEVDTRHPVQATNVLNRMLGTK
jgi:hypothetical protein